MDKRSSVIVSLIGLVLLSPAVLALVALLTNSFAWVQAIALVFAIVLSCIGVAVIGWGVWGLVRDKF